MFSIFIIFTISFVVFILFFIVFLFIIFTCLSIVFILVFSIMLIISIIFMFLSRLSAWIKLVQWARCSKLIIMNSLCMYSRAPRPQRKVARSAGLLGSVLQRSRIARAKTHLSLGLQRLFAINTPPPSSTSSSWVLSPARAFEVVAARAPGAAL